ncbi:MAG TPA: helix-turn-helix domain-containing protein [Streptosporangiaceae bacterium]|nr:helix-turn-helix domain-containing protein [Streptosporangiaceae bacterium]
MDAADDLTAVALLAEPIRQRLYLYLRERDEPVGREEVARELGVKARHVAFHLDKMAEAGLLEVEYRRLSGRTGPGAGRTAKVYWASSRSFSVLIPQTRYALAASMMASALSAGGSGADGADSLQDVATSVGGTLGGEIRQQTQTNSARQEAVWHKLEQLGYEPQVEKSGEWTLRNCIFSELSTSHRELVCGMNAALIGGVVDGAHLLSLHVERRRAAWPACCIRLTSQQADARQ